MVVKGFGAERNNIYVYLNNSVGKIINAYDDSNDTKSVGTQIKNGSVNAHTNLCRKWRWFLCENCIIESFSGKLFWSNRGIIF